MRTICGATLTGSAVRGAHSGAAPYEGKRQRFLLNGFFMKALLQRGSVPIIA